MRCKPGVMAYVIREDKGHEENIGKIVEVIELDNSEPFCGWIVWGEQKLIVNNIDEKGKFINEFRSHVAIIPDEYLLPISDPPKQKVVEETKELCYN